MKAQVRPKWISGIAVVSLIALIAMTLGVAIVHGEEKDEKKKGERVRWDIILLTTPGATVNPGGQASALNNIGDQITFTGTGTFVTTAGGGGPSDNVTGGGTWTVTAGGG